MKRCAWLVLMVWPAYSHVVSMSSGDLTIEGQRARFELRMPLYEVAHVPQPETTLLDHIRFATGGRPARLVTKTCQPDTARDSYVYTAEYEFAAPVDILDVE